MKHTAVLSLFLAVLTPATALTQESPPPSPECSHLLQENQGLQMQLKAAQENLRQMKMLYDAKLEAATIRLRSYEKDQQQVTTTAKLDSTRDKLKTAILPIEKWQTLLIRAEPLSKSQLSQLIGMPAKVVKGRDADSFRTERWFYPGRVNQVEDPQARLTLVVSFGGVLVEKISAGKE